MKVCRTEVEVCEVDTAPPQSERQEGSNWDTAEDLGLASGGGADTPELGLVDLDRALVADAMYLEALPGAIPEKDLHEVLPLPTKTYRCPSWGSPP